MLGLGEIGYNFSLLETRSPACLHPVAPTCQLSILLAGVLHTRSVFPEKNGIFVPLSGALLRGVSWQRSDCRGTGGGAGRPSSLSSAVSVIFGHSAVFGGLRTGARRLGGDNRGSLSLMKAKPPILPHANDQRERGESEQLLLCPEEIDFFFFLGGG